MSTNLKNLGLGNIDAGRAMLACILLLVGGVATSADSAYYTGQLGSGAMDYRSFDPGVPMWPSTCNCISIAYSDRDEGGKIPARFSIGHAAGRQGQDKAAMSAPFNDVTIMKLPMQQPLQPRYQPAIYVLPGESAVAAKPVLLEADFIKPFSTFKSSSAGLVASSSSWTTWSFNSTEVRLLD